jgi:signal transduction protein with GAF and PtsI domain
MAAVIPIVTAVAGLAGTVMQVQGTLQQGREQQARYEYEQKVQEQQADEAQAASQRDAAARHREGELILSQQRAGIAASGGGLAEGGVIDLMGDTKERVEFAKETELYKGEQQAKGYDDAAKVAGINAENAMKSAQYAAAGQLFSGVTSMFSRFGQSMLQNRSSSTNPNTQPLYQ